MVRTMNHTGPTNVVPVADCNSLLDETLDLIVSARETTSDNTYVRRKATQAAQIVEVDSYMQSGLLDGWLLIDGQSDDPTGDGIDIPGKRAKTQD